MMPIFSRTILVLMLSLVSSGCIYTSEISKTRKVIEQETDSDFETGIVVSMGSGLFQTAGWLANYVDDEDAELASRIAYGIRRVKAGYYPVESIPNLDSFDIPEMERFKRKGWKPALKVEDDDEVSWLLYRERNGRVHDLFVVAITEDELVLGRLQGNLNALLNMALTEAEDGFQTFENYDFEDWFENP